MELGILIKYCNNAWFMLCHESERKKLSLQTGRASLFGLILMFRYKVYRMLIVSPGLWSLMQYILIEPVLW